jgi:large subunit ribosomal protein L1
MVKKAEIKNKLTKRFQKLDGIVNNVNTYSLTEAIELVKQTATAKFDETLDISCNLGVDPKHSDQMVRGMVSMPHGTGKTSIVAVFAKDAKAEEAKKAGADFVGGDDLADQIKNNEITFDVCIATPDMMGVVGKVAKILGPKGKMPNPKLGTVTLDVTKAIENAKKGQVEFRVEKAGIVHAGVGKMSFNSQSLLENLKEFISALIKARPAAAKGVFLKSMTLGSTMGPAVKVDVAEFQVAKTSGAK